MRKPKSFNILTFTLLILFTSPSWANTLIISDSHGTGAFGLELTHLLEKDNEQISFYAFGGSKPIDWIEGNNLTWGFWEYHTGKENRRGDNRSVPKLIELISEHRPEKVIINLGTNIVWHEQTEKDRHSIQLLMKTAKDVNADCVWIGPPDLNVPEEQQKRWVRDVHQELQELSVTEECQLIESWKFTHYPKNSGDGVHYDKIPIKGPRLAKNWARKVYSRLSN
jgi:hypothetical protein